MSEHGERLECPYVGLAPFEAEHRDYFFGRTLDSAILADNVLAVPIVVLYGASAVGKSSLLNVGLPRALRDLRVSAQIVSRREWHQAGLLSAWLEEVTCSLAESSQPVVVVLDQFEEYFLYSDSEQVQTFTKALATLVARTDIEVHLLFSLRDDSLHRLDTLRGDLPEILETTLELSHFEERAVREAITEPIRVWNEKHSLIVALDDDFASTLIAQLRPKDPAGQPISGARIELAYLQLALERIWDAEGGVNATALRTKTFTTDLQGVGEISRRHVEEVLGRLSEEDKSLSATVFDRLVTPSGGKILYATTDLAAIAKVDEKRMERVLGTLAQGKARLLRSLGLPGGGKEYGYEILHDILARPILAWTADRAAEVARTRAAEERRAREKAERYRTTLVTLVFLLSFAVGLAGFMWSRAAQEAARADESGRQELGIRLLIESRAMLRGDYNGGDERALLTLLAAHLVAPSPETLGGLHSGLDLMRSLHKVIATPTVVNAVALSADGERIVSGGDDGKVRLWDAKTGELIDKPLQGSEATIYSVALSRDGKRIAAGDSDGKVRLWDAETREPIGKPLQESEAKVFSVALSRDGRRVAAGDGDGKVWLWDAEVGKAVGKLPEAHRGRVWSVSLSDDGKRIISAGQGGELRLWDAEAGKAFGSATSSHKGQVLSVAMTAEGRRFVLGYLDGVVEARDSEGNSIVNPTKAHRGQVWSVALSADGNRIASAGEDGAIRLWDTSTGSQVSEPLRSHTGAVSSVALSANGKQVASGGPDRMVRVWKVEADERAANTSGKDGHFGPVWGFAFSSDGKRMVSGGTDGTVRLWNSETGALVRTLEVNDRIVWSVALNEDLGRISSGGADGTVRLWNSETGEPIGKPFKGDDARPVRSVAFSAKGKRLVSAGDDGVVRLWRAESGESINHPPMKHDGPIASVAMNADGTRIVSGGENGTARLWNADTGEQIGDLLGRHGGAVFCVSFSPDGERIVSGDQNGALRLWSVEGRNLIREPIAGHKGVVLSVSFSADGKFIVSGGSDRKVRLWDAATGRPVGESFTEHEGSVRSVAFRAADERIIAGEGSGRVLILDAPSIWAKKLCSKLTRNMELREWREWVSPEIKYMKQCFGLAEPLDGLREDTTRR